MKVFKRNQHAGGKFFLILLLALLAFQSLGLNGLAAPATLPHYFQNGGGLTALSCSAPIHRNAQVVLMIDDSGSMIATNDPKDRATGDMQRNIAAQGIVDELQNTLELQDTEVAVIHFAWDLKPKAVDLSPQQFRRLENKGALYTDINLNKNFPYELERTNFVKLFTRVSKLWNSTSVSAADDDILRIFFLFSDGTPDYGKGELKGDDFDANIHAIAEKFKNLPPVDKIYFIGYGPDLNKEKLLTAWYVEKNGKDGKGGNPDLPNLEAYNSDEFKALIENGITKPDIAVKLDTQASSPQVGIPVSVAFQLVHSPDGGAIPSEGSPPGYKLDNVSVTDGSQNIPVTANGTSYQFSWTPQNTQEKKFNVVASFVNEKGNKFDCSGIIPVGAFITVTPDTITPTPTSTDTIVTKTSTPTPASISPPPPLALSLIIMPPRLPFCSDADQTIVLPMKLNTGTLKLDSEAGVIKPEWYKTSVQGISDGKEFGEVLTVVVEPVDAEKGKYNLNIAPLPNAEEIEVKVGARVNVDGQTINIPEATGIIALPPRAPNCIVCMYEPAWRIWFWPLLIGLIGLMILLLVLRAGSMRDEPEDERANVDIFRRRDWHLLFWPLVVLLILLVVVWLTKWICTVPPWLFLVALLVWLIMALLLRFFPDQETTSRSRAWWLLILLLALAFLGFLTITVSSIPALSLLWLVAALLLIWVIVRYISSYRPLAYKMAILELEMETPGSCVPYNREISIPLHFEFQGKEILVPLLTLTPSVRLSPAGQVGARVEHEGSGEYRLIIDPVKYDKENPARQIHVQAHGEAKLSDGRSVDAYGKTTIQICPPDNLAELEGIGEDVQELLYTNNIFTFKQLAQADHKIINEWLNLAGWKMMDSKTWPQQAKLADIARKYGKEDKKNYEAYKAWLKDGIEPDEQDKDEKDRRPTALFWNLVSQFTPVIFRLDLNPERILGAVTLPVQLKYEGDGTWISAVEWENTAMDIHSGKKVETEIRPIQAASGKYELSIEPDPGVKEIHLTVRAHIHGRSIEIYDPTSRVEIYLSRDIIMVPIPPPTPKAKDDLTELEGIGQVTEKILNARGIITFQQLAETSTDDITTWLNNADLKMLDPKTWPQQAKLADLAKRYGGNDIKIYEAYKAWLKDGIEPDEYAEPEKGRRDAALVWNRIAEFTPVIFSLALPSSGVHLNESIVLPIKLNRAEDQVSLSTVEWNVSSRSTPGGKEVKTTVNTIDAEKGAYELVIDPAQDPDAREIQVSIQACVNGRSIEIYYGKAITVQVSPIPGADPLEELEGIGEAMKKLLNEKGIYTFSQLANTDLATLNRWLNEKGYQRIDPKTWPQQAKLADVAYKYGRQEDRQSYEAYKAWLVRGIEPDEVDKDEKDRRPVARAWPIAPDSMPDPLEELEGIGKDVAQVLHDKGIFTFKQLAKADIKKISAWLNECGYERMDPKTWPQQAKLTGIAKEFGMEEDRRSYEAYKAWLKGGIEPDEYLKDEQDRRPVALTWHGTAELTEKAYPEIFG